ncbi:hypothetical protein SUDANB120_00135 [Streptomyces sp. enrichment culture]|uniref:MerR family transcriptional regulator n=1 Tax=Streptomyces TaxID=1883 RepID=UPI001673E1DD|nr:MULTISPECIES: MerR family transcriptional regulator [Streptomyces]MBD3579290.1 MerR family transcriptional regulator [Streptomyces sp. KD18]GGT03185.1 transcriptional regulator [Streptomyces toxytricini]
MASPHTDRPPPQERYGLSTGAVARRLGVSPTTVRSWEKRYGMAPEERQEGRHRRWAPRDVAMLEDMCRLTASGVPPAEAARAARAARHGTAAAPALRPSPGSGAARLSGPERPRAPGGVRPECRGLARAALRLDSPAVEAVLGGAVRDLGVVSAWEEVMAPALHAVGRRWGESGERYVEVEHLLSWHVSTVLRTASACGPPAVGAPPVLVACMPQEQHTLPLEVLVAGLAERALPTRMLGASVPAEALVAAVRRSGPAAVVLWSQSRCTADAVLARRVVQSGFGLKGARTAPLVLLAGPGWPTHRLPRTALHPSGLREALHALSGLYRSRPAGA